MSNILIRGIPKPIHVQVQRLAKSNNLSVNQALLQLIRTALEQTQRKNEEEEQRANAFNRLQRIRAQLHEKYGKFDDSTKLIREERDKR